MRSILLLSILLLTSNCRVFKEDALKTIRMDVKGKVIAINHKYSVFVVRFNCSEIEHKCYKDVIYDLRLVDYVEVGMKWPQ